jgi:transposase
MDRIVIGIDISKKNFDLALNFSGKKWLNRVFTNDQKGFESLLYWLQQKEICRAMVALEATGCYAENLARFLYDKGYTVLVLNPAQVKYFGKSKLSRAKTDKKDARLIAEFVLTNQDLKPWVPLAPNQEKLRELFRCLVRLKEDRVQQLNRLESVRNENVRTITMTHFDFLNEQIKALEEQIRDLVNSDPDLKENVELLKSIPGIGEVVSWGVLSESPDLKNFKNARQLAAFAGLNPSVFESGTSVRGRTSISKIGSGSLRKLLYMPGMSAMQFNPVIKAFAQTLRAKGKNGKVIVVACMRKLLHIIYGVLSHKQPFTVG